MRGVFGMTDNEFGMAKRWLIGFGVVIAIAAIAAASCAFATMRQVDRINRLEVKLGTGDISRAAQLADRGPQNRHLTLTNTDGSRRLDVVVTESGLSYVTGATLPITSDDKAYQLWAVVTDARVSIGQMPMMKSGIGNIAFYMPEGASRLELTLESARGAVLPSQVLISGEVLPYQKVSN